MSKPKYPSLEEYYNDIARQAVEECVLCGECVESCMMYPLPPLKEKDPTEVIQSIIDFLKDGVFSEEVYLKAFSCAGCGHCSDSCPQGIDPMLLHDATKIELIKQGKKLPEAANLFLKLNYHGVTSALQIKPPEERWLKRAPDRPEKTENVVFLGCESLMRPHKAFASLDVLEGMGVDFVALVGGELCCGVPEVMIAANAKESEEKARELVASVKAFSPKRLILTCAGCYRQITEFFPHFLDLDFEVQYFPQFLNENLDKIKFTKPLEKTVTLHDGCQSQRTKLADSVIKLLEAIPGLKLVGKGELCCGGLANVTYPQMAQKFRPALIEETMKAGADYITDTCTSCTLSYYMYLKQYPLINVKDIAALVNESMGGREYEDKFEECWKCESLDELIEKTRENFEANGYTEEAMRQILPYIFYFC